MSETVLTNFEPPASARKKALGVVLFQLGGPDSPAAVEPFLYNLFCDPDIINFPLAWIARRPLARYIAKRRARVVREHYEAIGGQSPIRLLTERQARKLAAALAPEFDVKCWVAMRYWHPLTAETVAEVRAASLDELVLLPLYPQYSLATTASSLKEWRRVYSQAAARSSGRSSVHAGAGAPSEALVENFHLHPLYIEALTERINTALTHFDDPGKVHLVFSAHGLPLSLIAKGDPYERQIGETVRAVMARGAWPNAHTLCYQSRVGRQKWLGPPLEPTIERLTAAGAKHLLVIPISFVTEHIETLHEINIEARAAAMKAGVEQFEMMAAVGDSPRFIGALADVVRTAVRTGASERASATAASGAESFKSP
jgi:protoporphyrin/coproporphyrin ferrochelatase